MFGAFKRPACASMISGEQFYTFPYNKKSSKEQYQSQFILNHQDYDITVIEKPNVPENELKKALMWEAKHIYAENYDNIIWDYYSQPDNQISHSPVLNLVSASKDKIAVIKNKAKLAGVTLTKITIAEIIYKNIHLHDSENACFVIGGDSFGKVVIIKDKKIYFSRKFGLLYGNKDEQRSYTEQLILELHRSLDYFERQYRLLIPADFVFLGEQHSNTVVQSIKKHFTLKSITQWNEPVDKSIAHISSDKRFLLSNCIQPASIV